MVLRFLEVLITKSPISFCVRPVYSYFSQQRNGSVLLAVIQHVAKGGITLSATPSYAPFSLTGDSLVDVATHGYYWHLDSTRTIRWSIAGGFNGEYWINPQATASMLSQAFNSFSTYANVKFSYTGYYQTPATAAPYSDISVSMDANNRFFSSSSQWARSFFPNYYDNYVYSGAPGDVFLNLNSEANTLSSYAPGSAGFFLIIHEIGHSLGLKHPHDDGGTGRPTFSNIGMQDADIDWLTIMSYNDDYDWNRREYDPSTPMLQDVIALQYLYGRNMATNAGDTVHRLIQNNKYQTIWDAGGRNTIDLSTSTTGWKIVLPYDQVSSLVLTIAGYAVPTADATLMKNGTSPKTLYWLTGEIQNVKGTAYADTIYGGLSAGTLEGNAGNDIIFGSDSNDVIMGGDGNDFLKGEKGNDLLSGGNGVDFAIYSGRLSGYTIKSTGSNAYTVSSNLYGTDSIGSVERLIFDDKSVAIDISGTAGQAYRIYQAAFDRTPDSAGLGYWIAQMDNGISLESVSAGFISSNEFKSIYGASPTAYQFITKLYNNVLHRAPEQSGYDWWVNTVSTGAMSWSQALVGFSESQENQLQVIGKISNGFEYTPWLG